MERGMDRPTQTNTRVFSAWARGGRTPERHAMDIKKISEIRHERTFMEAAATSVRTVWVGTGIKAGHHTANMGRPTQNPD